MNNCEYKMVLKNPRKVSAGKAFAERLGREYMVQIASTGGRRRAESLTIKERVAIAKLGNAAGRAKKAELLADAERLTAEARRLFGDPYAEMRADAGME